MQACSLQSCPTLSHSMDCSPQVSSVHGILQARILEWATMPSSRGFSQPRDRTPVSCISCTEGGFSTTEPPGKPMWRDMSDLKGAWRIMAVFPGRISFRRMLSGKKLMDFLCYVQRRSSHGAGILVSEKKKKRFKSFYLKTTYICLFPFPGS